MKHEWACFSEFAEDNVKAIKKLSYVKPETVTTQPDTLRGWVVITAEHNDKKENDHVSSIE